MPDYKSDAGLLEHLLIQAETISQYQAQAGASNADVTSITEDAAVMAALVAAVPLTDEYKTTAYGIKQAVIRGEIGAAVGNFMDAPDLTMPFTMIAGIEKRSRDRDGRFKRSPAITEGALFGLDLKDAAPSPPPIPTPLIEVFGAKTGYEFAVVVHDRGASDMYEVQIRRPDSNKWQTIKSGTGKSVSVTVEPTTPDQPEQLLVRVQLIKKNAHYGEPSEPSYVTVSP